MLLLYMKIIQDRHVQNNIYVKFKGTIRGQKAFSYSGACIWNLILSHIETDCAIGTFKNFFAKLLLNSKEDLLST